VGQGNSATPFAKHRRQASPASVAKNRQENTLISSSFHPRHPRLALVLGSGGVRSIAGVGIAQVLTEAGLRPDLVVGCSSGALFGATVAVGMSSEEALKSATTLWSAELTEQRRWRAYAQLVAPRWAGFGDDFAMRDDRLIAQRIQAAFGSMQLQDLPTPLRVAATEAASGAGVVLSRGSLVQALRASMAVPFIFPSINFEGRRLVDGVMSDPLPVAAAFDADVVVTLGLQGALPRRVDGPSRLVAQATTTLINNLQAARLGEARASGRAMVCIELGLDRRVGLWETGAMPYLVDAGRRAAKTQLPHVLALMSRTARGQPARDAA
jgi:NTE family protein